MANLNFSVDEFNSALNAFIANPNAPQFQGPPLAVQQPSVNWATDNIQPPPQLYLYKEDDILWDVLSDSGPITVSLEGTILQPSGITSRFTSDLTAPNIGLVSWQRFHAGEGFLLQVSIRAKTAGHNPGRVYIQLGISRDQTEKTAVTRQLIAGYIVDNFSLTWPWGVQKNWLEGPGWVHDIIVADPAAGANWIATVPAPQRWRLKSVLYTFTCSGVAANRRSRLVVLGEFGQQNVNTQPVLQQIAGSTNTYSYFNGAPFVVPVAGVNVALPLPDVVLHSGGSISSSTNGLDAGDQYSGIALQVESWVEF
jgi:hypothetical protein